MDKFVSVPISNKFGGAVEIYDNAIDNCEEIISNIEDTLTWEYAKVASYDHIDEKMEGKQDLLKRNNKVAIFDPTSLIISDTLRNFCKTVWFYVNDYSLRYGQYFSHIEPVNINKYLPGENFKIHADAGPNLPRVISALVYLNDVDGGGGDTYFPHFDSQILPKRGRLVIFPSNYPYAHGANAPISDIKYSAAFWFRG